MISFSTSSDDRVPLDSDSDFQFPSRHRLSSSLNIKACTVSNWYWHALDPDYQYSPETDYSTEAHYSSYFPSNNNQSENDIHPIPLTISPLSCTSNLEDEEQYDSNNSIEKECYLSSKDSYSTLSRPSSSSLQQRAHDNRQPGRSCATIQHGPVVKSSRQFSVDTFLPINHGSQPKPNVKKENKLVAGIKKIFIRKQQSTKSLAN